LFNARQLNTTPLNTGLISANVLSKSTVTIIGTTNVLAKSTANVISTANTLFKSTVNVGLEVNALAKSTVTVNSNASVSLNSVVSINYNPLPSLYVFSSSEQLQAILINNGNACPFFGAEHDEKINLENTFTFRIPSNHPDAQFVVEGNLIAFQDLDYNWQLFEIKRTVDIDQTGSIKTVYCDHAYYELLGDIVTTGGGTSTSAWIAIISALSQSRWEAGNIVNLGTQTTNFSYQTALACIQQVATTWKGEIQFRIIIVNGLITHRYVDLIAQRGSSTGKQFVFGKDLVKVEREVDFTNVYTAMYGRGKASTSGVRLNFASINANKEYVVDASALAQYGLAGGTRHRFGIFDDPQEISQANLLANTTASLQSAKVPAVNYQFQVVSLEQISPDYAHEKVRIGDTALAIDDNLVPALQIQVRVIEIKRNLLEYDKTQISLGNFKPDLAYTQNIQAKINQKVANNSGIWDNASALVPSVLDATVFDLTAQLRAAGGYVYFSPADGIMVYDTPDPATATKVMKLGAGIFGIANSKTNGVWNWKTFGDGTGFTADLITAGKISADKVQIGTGAQVLGSSTFYWDISGLYAVSGLNVVKITSTGISLGTNGVGGAFSSALTSGGLDANNSPVTATGTIINSSGVTITNGALSVKNPAGNVVIDGTSNMFKIVVSGTLTLTISAGTTTATNVFFHNLGYIPAFDAFVLEGIYVEMLPVLVCGSGQSTLTVVSQLSVDVTSSTFNVYYVRTADKAVGTAETFTIKYFIYKEAAI